MFDSLCCSDHSPQPWAQCTQALSLFSSSREAVLTLSIKQTCLMSADPGSFSPRKSHGLRSAEVCWFPGSSGPQGRCLEALDSGLGLRGACLWDMEHDPLFAKSPAQGAVRKIGTNNTCPRNCLGLIRRLIMHSVCLG